jgi:hypothetical protein
MSEFFLNEFQKRNDEVIPLTILDPRIVEDLNRIWIHEVTVEELGFPFSRAADGTIAITIDTDTWKRIFGSYRLNDKNNGV